MNDYNLIEEFEEDFRLLESDDNSSHSEDENDRQTRLGNIRTFYSQRRKIFELFDDEKTRKTFRFDKPSIMYITSNFRIFICFYVKLRYFLLIMIIDLLTPFLKVRIIKAKRRITPFDQVLIALQFYGTGTFQTVVGNVLKYSQATVCRSIHDVSRALCIIARDHINFPPNLLQVSDAVVFY